MNQCEWTDSVLEACPDALRGDSEDELGVHLRTCAPCRAAAERILEASAELDRRLAHVPSFDAGAIVAQADELARAEVRRATSWRRPVGWASVALAAGIAALLLADRFPPDAEIDAPLDRVGVPPTLVPPRSPVTSAEGSPGPSRPAVSIDAVSSGDIAVLATSNPDITVLWFFSGD